MEWQSDTPLDDDPQALQRLGVQRFGVSVGVLLYRQAPCNAPAHPIPSPMLLRKRNA